MSEQLTNPWDVARYVAAEERSAALIGQQVAIRTLDHEQSIIGEVTGSDSLGVWVYGFGPIYTHEVSHWVRWDAVSYLAVVAS